MDSETSAASPVSDAASGSGLEGLEALPLEALVAVAALTLAGLALRSWRRRVARRSSEAAAGSPEAEARDAGRWGAWFAASYPWRVCNARVGDPLELRAAADAADSSDARDFEQQLEPEHRAALRGWVQRAMAGRPPEGPLELLWVPDRAAPRWIELLLRLEATGGASRLDGVARDVTARREAELEASLRAAVEEEMLLNTNAEAALRSWTRVLAEALCCSYAETWWVEEGSDTLQPGEVWHADRPELADFARRARESHFSKGEGLAGRVWAEGLPRRVDDLHRAAKSEATGLEQTGLFEAALALPLRSGDRVLGVLVLLGHSLAPAGRERLERIAQLLGTAVERKQRERTVRGTVARKNAILDSALDSVISIDAEGRIVEFNPSAENAFGRQRSEVIGQPMAELLVPEELRERQREALRRCLEQSGNRPAAGARYVLDALRADGSRFPAEISVAAIHVGGAPTFTAFLRDITERVELDRLKDELVSTVSHELRTPLTSIRGFVELLLEREFEPAEQRSFLEIVDTEMKRLGKLIDDFLDLQRLEAGALDYDFEPLELEPLVEEALEMFRPGHEAHEYRLDRPEAPTRVEADADRLRQTLRNLLSNATKYSPDGGEVVVRVRDEGEHVRVGVRDQGIGMDAATVEKLFTRFFRADSTATRRIGGTGLGLSLVKEIIEAHGGEVGVTSELGAGSEFWFTLPLEGAGTTPRRS